MTHPEHALQRAIKVFTRRCVMVPHEFVSHDRAAPRSEFDHVWQSRRGIRRSWPDSELVLEGGRTFRCELKRPGVSLGEDSHQSELLTRLNDLGHLSAWANSVTMYGEQCERFNISLRGNWRTVAQIADEHVLAEIRKEKAKPKKAASPILKLRAVRVGRPTIAQIRNGGMNVEKLP